MNIGCHLSSSGGYLAMAQTAESIGANVFQFFTRNPRGGAAKPIDKHDVADFLTYAREHGIGPILAHAPYTLNAASADAHTREFAEKVFIDDLKRLALTPGAMYNFHPGSHVGQGAEKGIELISDLLVRVITAAGGHSLAVARPVSTENGVNGGSGTEYGGCPQPTTTILLETMAGKGSEVGRNFEEIRAIIDRVENQLFTVQPPTSDLQPASPTVASQRGFVAFNTETQRHREFLGNSQTSVPPCLCVKKEKDSTTAVYPSTSNLQPVLGVCLDTCHVWDGGYDIVNDLDGVLAEFDRVIGLERLKAIHINDSMNGLGSHKDRHEKIGKGKIGLDAFERLVNHPRLSDLPFYLETPCDLQGYKEEIALLKSLASGSASTTPKSLASRSASTLTEGKPL